MRIAIVLATQNAGWVIGKIAQRLCAELLALGHDAAVRDLPDEKADINHWMSYAFAEGCASTLNTVFVTHADDPFKVRLIRRLLEGPIQLALCMSPHAADDLAVLGVDEKRLWHILPAIDGPLEPRRIRIGITSRVYDDGRKREEFLVRLAQAMNLASFCFEIFGAGWEPTIRRLTQAGAEVVYDAGSDDWQADYARIRRAVPEFDYYLYLGMDEGSLGTLDAVSAGVKTIVTAQGFHLSIPGGITHPFTEFVELKDVFSHLDAERRERAACLRNWTWSHYAAEHVNVWELVRIHGKAAVPREELAALCQRIGQTTQMPRSGSERIAHGGWDFRRRMLQPARIRGAIARMSWLRPLRKLIGQ